MKSITQLVPADLANLKFIFTDIDDTLTNEGKLLPEAYEALWQLHQAKFNVIPITGRPAGWCELIARQWPVEGIVGENGAFYFRYSESTKTMKRHFFYPQYVRNENQKKLEIIRQEILQKIPACNIAGDQFSRLFDLAIDFAEDMERLSDNEIQNIVQIFESHGATAKVSSIHVNGWFGNYDKLTMTLKFMQNEFSLDEQQTRQQSCFFGDSPNDEPMFAFFPLSFGVANLKQFQSQLKALPTYMCASDGGHGFKEAVATILNLTK
jgi:HAD superfamily hydrolase (TIGR01484 family)